MTPPLWNESPISLDKLDDNLKAMLRLKIREFVHLSPWFKNIPSFDPTTYVNSGVGKPNSPWATEEPCPHRKHDGRIAVRRNTRPHHASGLV